MDPNFLKYTFHSQSVFQLSVVKKTTYTMSIADTTLPGLFIIIDDKYL